MNTIQKYAPFLTSALLMCVALCIIYPHYQYYIDPDGTAYLTIAQRYATGDYATAINGYWSPWACWLTALLIKAGMAAIPSSVVVNAAGATGFLYIAQSLFIRFNMEKKLQWLLCGTLAFFLCYAIFWQSFDDLWECFFLLATLRLMLIEDYKSRLALWVLSGVVGALAYFAKAYSFPFFILSTLCCTYFICNNNKAQWLKMSLTSIAVMLLCSLPWILALHHKYGIWTTSTSGSLNMSWYLTGHPSWKEGIAQLLPPAHKDSPCYWEDPYLANGPTPHFWDSLQLFGRQLLKIVHNLYKLVVSMVQLSFFFPLAAFLLFRVIINKSINKDNPVFVIALSFLLFPLGYLLVNFESRYLWYMLPLAMVAGGLFIQKQLSGKFYSAFLPWLFAISFLTYPAWGLLVMYDEGKDQHRIAEQLKQLNIHGSFTAATTPGVETQRIERIAYFSGNSLYSIPARDVSKADVLKEMRRYGIKYYFAYESCPECRSGVFAPAFTDEAGVTFPEVTKGAICGLRVFLVTP